MSTSVAFLFSPQQPRCPDGGPCKRFGPIAITARPPGTRTEAGGLWRLLRLVDRPHARLAAAGGDRDRLEVAVVDSRKRGRRDATERPRVTGPCSMQASVGDQERACVTGAGSDEPSRRRARRCCVDAEPHDGRIPTCLRLNTRRASSVRDDHNGHGAPAVRERVDVSSPRPCSSVLPDASRRAGAVDVRRAA
jgi:hypothetical protein